MNVATAIPERLSFTWDKMMSSGDQNLVRLYFPRDDAFGVRHGSVFEARVDHDFVFPLRELTNLSLRQTESP